MTPPALRDPISPDLTDGPGSGGLIFGTLTAIDIAPSDPNTIYAGSDDGNVHVTTNGGASWTEIDAGLPVRYIKRVTADPFDDAIAYVAISGYNQDDYAARADAYDVVFDTVGKSTFARARHCLARGGRYLITVGGPGLYVLDAWSRAFGSRKLVFGMSVDKSAGLPAVADLVARRALRPVIDRRYPLEQIADAHRYLASNQQVGKIVVIP